MLTQCLPLLLAIWPFQDAPPTEASTIEFSKPVKRDLPLPSGCEMIGANHVAYPCADYKSEVIKEGFIMSTGQVASLFGALSKSMRSTSSPRVAPTTS